MERYILVRSCSTKILSQDMATDYIDLDAMSKVGPKEKKKSARN
jgi:hypothetical protein